MSIPPLPIQNDVTQTARGTFAPAWVRWLTAAQQVLSGYLSSVGASGTSVSMDSAIYPAGSVVRFTSGSSSTATLPKTTPAGWWIECRQIGAGQVTFSPSSGATLRNRSSHTKTAGQWAVVRLACDRNDDGQSAVFILSGDTAA